MSTHRYSQLVTRAIDDFELDLTGLCVYTEAATGAYRVTAPLAALAGADQVYAIAKESRHGDRSDAISQTEKLAAAVGVRDRIQFVSRKRREHVGEADVITNSGFVRPIDATVVSWMKPTAVVPLMYETWEFRPEDVDIEACWRDGVPVLGTDEGDERVLTKEYVGPLVVKLALEEEIEVFQSNIVLVGSGPMAGHAVRGLEALGAVVTVVSREPRDPIIEDRQDARTLAGPHIHDRLSEADALVLVEHWEDAEIVGSHGDITASQLAQLNPSIVVIHVCGSVDGDDIASADVRCTPSDPARFGHMSFTLGYVGPKPIVKLQAAGLRVGQLMARGRNAGASPIETVEALQDDPIVDDFSEEFKSRRDFGRPGSQ